jgi:integrase
MPVVNLTKREVDAAQPSEHEWCLWDQQLSGFGLRVRPSGVKTYVVTYRAGHGRQAPLRRYTIGRHGAPWTPEQARREAKRVLGEVAAGRDPAKQRQRSRQADKEAPTVRDVADQWLAEHVEPKRKPRTLHNYRTLLHGVIVPALGAKKMTALTRADVARLHYARRSTPYQANCVLRALGAMCAWAEGHGFLPEHSNPVRRVEKYREHPRERFLSPRELYRLGRALRAAERCGAITPWAAGAIRLLLFVGARRSEILEARWEWVDQDRATILLPDSKTGKKVVHLNAPAPEVLTSLPRLDGNPFIIAGGKTGGHLVNLGKAWQRVRKAALLGDVRLHDLRHSFASVAVAGGLTLPLIGGLLGHRQTQTTARYAHLAADPLRAAAELVGSRIAAAMAGGAKANVVTPLKKR